MMMTVNIKMSAGDLDGRTVSIHLVVFRQQSDADWWRVNAKKLGPIYVRRLL